MGTYGPSVAVDDEPINNSTVAGTANKIKYCKWCDAQTNHTTRRSKDCLKHEEWKQEQIEKKRKIQQRNNNRNDRDDCTHQIHMAVDPNQIEISVAEVTVENKTNATIAVASEQSMLIAAADKYEELNILENKNAIAEIMIGLKGKNFERNTEKSMNNVSSPGRTNFAHTSPDVFCTFVDPVYPFIVEPRYIRVTHLLYIFY